MTKEEVEEFIKMMEWARQDARIRSLNLKTEKNPIGKDIYVITSWFKDKRVMQGSGYTVTEAMQGFTRNIPTMGLIEEVFK